MRVFIVGWLVWGLVGSAGAQGTDHTPVPDCPMRQAVTASPYSGFENREIKALSDEDRDRLLSGHGMGLALAAELNRFPGPKHVIELAAELELDADQVLTAREIFEEMERSARSLGRDVLREEALLDARFADGTIDLERLTRSVQEIARLRGELRLVHLIAHLRMRAVMSEEQIEEYDRVRGYRR